MIIDELTLQQLFGARAYQDSDRLVINKGDLSLSASAANTAESLLVAILVNAHRQFEGYLTDPANNRVTDANKATITYRHKYENTDLTYWKRQYLPQSENFIVLDTFVLETYEIYTDGD